MLKAEDPAAYKKMAEEGIMVAHPVSIKGQSVRPDIGIGYHSTVKFFDPSKDHPEAIHNVARDLKMTPPDPHTTGITPSMFKDRFGNDVYVVKLHGEHADKIKENHSKFSHMGHPSTYEFTPHISVDKATWEHIVDSGAKTAHEAGIEFGHAQLKQGHKVLTNYKHGSAPAPIKQEGDKLAASESMVGSPLEKSVKQMASAAVMAGIIGLSTPTQTASPSVPTETQHQQSHYDSGRMLRTIAQVESSGGKFANHRMLGGMHEGESAYGKYGLTPVVIRETVGMNKDLKGKYGKVQGLEGQDLHHFMQDSPGLEEQVASKHLERLEHHFGKDPASIAYSWLNGIQGTYKAKKDHVDLNKHWHVAKALKAYGEQK